MSSRFLLAQCEMISLESESGAAASASAVQRLPSYFQAVKSYLSKSVISPIENHFTSNDGAVFEKELKAHSYLELQDILIACPQGFKSDYITYTKALLEAAEMAGSVLAKNIEPYNRWLEIKLGSPETLNSLVTGKVEHFETLKTEAEIKTLQSYFVSNGKEYAETPYHNLVRRNNDWTEIHQRMVKIEAIFSPEHHKAVMEGTQRLSNNLDKLLTRITESNLKVSATAIKTLAERSLQCAQAVEFYALVRYKVQELESAMQDMHAKLKAVK